MGVTRQGICRQANRFQQFLPTQLLFVTITVSVNLQGLTKGVGPRGIVYRHALRNALIKFASGNRLLCFALVLVALQVLLAIGVIAILGPGIWGAAVAISIVYTPIFARLLRARHWCSAKANTL